MLYCQEVLDKEIEGGDELLRGILSESFERLAFLLEKDFLGQKFILALEILTELFLERGLGE